MSLVVVSTPIGNYGDITLRAIETLKTCDGIICEEKKPAEILLKRLKIEGKVLHQLNEHSKKEDLRELCELCKNQKMALISDCGTPGFYDPGAQLVEICNQHGIEVDINPGASSLMALLALSTSKMNEFHFVGFLPAENTDREKKISELSRTKIPLVFMDTPYRLNKTLTELAVVFGDREATLGFNLTMAEQEVHRGKLKKLASHTYPKAPFVLILSDH